MSITVVVAIIALCLMISAGFSANMILIMMIGEINRKRPEGNLISYFGFTYFKMRRIFREYRRLYPGGKLHIYWHISNAAAVIGVITVFVCLHYI
jgi:hypothetical protein